MIRTCSGVGKEEKEVMNGSFDQALCPICGDVSNSEIGLSCRRDLTEEINEKLGIKLPDESVRCPGTYQANPRAPEDQFGEPHGFFNFTISGEILARKPGIELYKPPFLGEATGLKLPDGSIVKLWVAGEHITDPDSSDEDYRDLTTGELMKLGIEIVDYTEQLVMEGRL